jgi:hypothetical protein
MGRAFLRESSGMSEPAKKALESHEFSNDDLADSIRTPAVKERRREGRHSIALRAKVTVLGLSVLPGHTVDLSRAGASLFLPFALGEGQRCAIDLELQACGITGGFHIPAEVRYCVETQSRYRIGVRFTDLDASTAALIASLLQSDA